MADGGVFRRLVMDWMDPTSGERVKGAREMFSFNFL